MKAIARVAAAFVCVVYGSAMFPSMLSSRSYEFQDREHPSSPPTGEFLLGTDALGRDRLSRLLHGARISLVLAPAAALLATVLAAFAGSLSLFFNPRMSSSMQAVVDLVISVPWLFLMLAIRALIPLNVSAWASVVVTFAVLGLLGWAPAVRVFQAAASHIAESDYVLQSCALGCTRYRLLIHHIVPNLLPVLRAQFLAFVPVFVLAETNLSMLGLGVTEPMPSLGNLVAELQNYTAAIDQPWIAAPAVLLGLVIAALQILVPRNAFS